METTVEEPPPLTGTSEYSPAPQDEELGTASHGTSTDRLSSEEDAKSTDTKNNNKDDTEDESAAAGASSPPSLTKILLVARPEWPALVFALLLMVGAESIELINPLVIARAYDALVDPTITSQDERLTKIHHAMILVMVLHLSGLLAAFVRHAILGAAGERLVARLRNQLYAAILKQEIAFFDEHKSGELVSRLGSDTTLLQHATSQSIPEFFSGMIKVLVTVALMFWISFKLAALTLGSVLLIFVVAVPFGMIIGKLSKSYQDELGAAQTRSTESLGSMRTVQSFAAEDRERERYRNKIGDPDDFPFWWPTKKNNHRGNTGRQQSTAKEDVKGADDSSDNKTTYSVGFFKAIWDSTFFCFIFGFGFAAMYASLWYGFTLVADGEITLGDLTAFQSYIFQIGFGLGGTSAHLTKVLEALGASGRIFYLMDRVPTIPTPAASNNNDDSGGGGTQKNRDNGLSSAPPTAPLLKPDSMEGAVTFDNVSFAYPSRSDVPVLTNFTLSVAPNTTTALVGSSGAGKSTVVALLQRFYDVNAGSIQIDGNDIRSLDLTWLRRQIGYVQQEPALFGLTVRENICYGVTDREVAQEEIEAVCQKANAHDFIMNWPKGYDTLVGERGVKLSGGQKQRISIARALLVNPRLLLLDEATSALDAESEHLVQEAIEKAVVGRTVLIVAHRLSTIQRATQIVVLDDHKMVDVGSHDELLRRCSKYQDLIKRQSLMHKGSNKNDGGGDIYKGVKDVDWEAVIRGEGGG